MMRLFYQIIQWLRLQMLLSYLELNQFFDISDENLCLDPNKLTKKLIKILRQLFTLH